MLSLVTYTCNDHDFALDLLKAIPLLARPDEVIVVDDGSSAPFPPQDGVRVVRRERNLGPAQAKRLGIGAARGDIVLSLDCDIRPDRRWLNNALPLLTDPTVALVSATVVPALADNYLSRARNRLLRPARKTSRTLFAGAGIWLFLKKQWEKLGGLDGYAQRTHEDVWFSFKAVAAGFKLLLADSWPVYEKRCLHRRQYWRRGAAYGVNGRFRADLCGLNVRAAATLREQLETALQYGKKSGELAFLYIEIVKIIVFIAQALKTDDKIRDVCPKLTSGNAVAAALWYFRAYPAVSALMEEDLAALGFSRAGDNADASLLSWLESIFSPVLAVGVMAELELSWPEQLRREDADRCCDGHYISSKKGSL
jgi:GT2 family glycosyltransferase